jgi:hypothetical protein
MLGRWPFRPRYAALKVPAGCKKFTIIPLGWRPRSALGIGAQYFRRRLLKVCYLVGEKHFQKRMRGGGMARVSQMIVRLLLPLGVGLACCVAAAPVVVPATIRVPSHLLIPQAAHQPPNAGVDNTKMGPYRALAKLAYASFQKGDSATAAELAHILERVWDKAEDYGGDTALSKTNPTLFKQVDKAMDDFITPLENYAKGASEAAKVKTAYNAYLEQLKLAD